MKLTIKIIAVMTLLLLVSCSILDKRQNVKQYISIHPVSTLRVKSKLYKELKIGEHTIYVHTVPMITNKYIYEAKTFEQENGLYGLKISLGSFGQRVWRQVTTNHAGDKAVLTVDGKYHAVVRFAPFYDPSTGDTVALPSNMSAEQADKASQFVRAHYELLND